MSMTPLPPLDRTSPTFRGDLDTFFLTRIPQFVTEANALQLDVQQKAAATTSAVEQALAAGLANAAANASQAQQDRIQTGQDRVATGQDRTQTGLDRQAVNTALQSIADGPVVSVGGASGIVTLKTINGAALVGAGDIAVGNAIKRSARTSNTALAAADNSKLIDVTAGTFTQTFAAAAALDDGWFVYLRNSGTGVVTLDPNASETIDGATTLVVHPGHTRLIQCDGAALRTVLVSGIAAMSVADEKPAGTGGGAGTTGTYVTRMLNTVRGNTIPGASLASNNVTLPAGAYLIHASCPGFSVQMHKARLQNVTSGTTLIGGSTEFIEAGTGTTRSVVSGLISLAAPSAICLQHFLQTNASNASAFGYPASGTGTTETYSEMTIIKVA